MLLWAQILDYDAGTHTATLQLRTSLGASLSSVPVCQSIAGSAMLAGRAAIIALPDTSNPSDCLVIAVKA